VEPAPREELPLPFPLTAGESELFCGEKLTRVLGLRYTPFREGMDGTWRAFKNVFT